MTLSGAWAVDPLPVPLQRLQQLQVLLGGGDHQLEAC